MNMYLHNIGTLDGEPNISLADSLLADLGKRYNLVITNPPFGKKSAQTITNDDGEDEKESVSYNRQGVLWGTRLGLVGDRPRLGWLFWSIMWRFWLVMAF